MYIFFKYSPPHFNTVNALPFPSFLIVLNKFLYMMSRPSKLQVSGKPMSNVLMSICAILYICTIKKKKKKKGYTPLCESGLGV